MRSGGRSRAKGIPDAGVVEAPRKAQTKEKFVSEHRNLLIGPGEGEVVLREGFGVINKISGAATGGAFAIVEHPLEPGALAAPPHTHTNEDEYSFVVEGEVSVMIGEDVYTATPGSYVLKPRGVPHTFWNAGSEPARIVEIISPAGFERYFEELSGILSAGGPPDVARIGALADRYGLAFHWERMEEISREYGVGLR